MHFQSWTGMGPLCRRKTAASLLLGFAPLFAFVPELPAEEPATILVAEMVTSRTATPAVVASGDPVWHDELESGWRESKVSGRPMVIFITSASCTFCDAMTRNTLCDETVRRRLAQGFVPIRLRPDHNGNVLSRVKVTTFPTTLVAIPEGKVVAERFGYQPPEQFHGLLLEASESIAARKGKENTSVDVH